MCKYLVLMRFLARCIVVAACLARPAVSFSFQDGFDTEPGSGNGASGQSGTPYADFANWTVSSGTVDLVADGDFGISCANGTGKCVDLDGSTSDAGVLTSTSQSLVPGHYIFSFELAGVSNNFGGEPAAAPNLVDVSVGEFFSQQFLRQQGDPFETFGGAFFVPEPTTVSIVFENSGNDNFGALLDNVVLTVPEPGIFVLLGSGTLLLIMASARSRRIDHRRRT